jgi:hypothetical protein
MLASNVPRWPARPARLIFGETKKAPRFVD